MWYFFVKQNFFFPIPMNIGAWRLRLPEWFFSIFVFLPMPNLSVLGEVFWLLIHYPGVKLF
jgi:hypothetical protein